MNHINDSYIILSYDNIRNNNGRKHFERLILLGRIIP